MIKKQHYNDVMGTLLNIYKGQEPRGEISKLNLKLNISMND